MFREIQTGFLYLTRHNLTLIPGEQLGTKSHVEERCNRPKRNWSHCVYIMGAMLLWFGKEIEASPSVSTMLALTEITYRTKSQLIEKLESWRGRDFTHKQSDQLPSGVWSIPMMVPRHITNASEVFIYTLLWFHFQSNVYINVSNAVLKMTYINSVCMKKKTNCVAFVMKSNTFWLSTFSDYWVQLLDHYIQSFSCMWCSQNLAVCNP